MLRFMVTGIYGLFDKVNDFRVDDPLIFTISSSRDDKKCKGRDTNKTRGGDKNFEKKNFTEALECWE